MQRATRDPEAAACRVCGAQPLHVHHLAGDGSHSYECPPCGVATGRFPSPIIARTAWWTQHGADTPNLPAVRPARVATGLSLPKPGHSDAHPQAPTGLPHAAGSAAAAPAPAVVVGAGGSVHHLIRSTRNNGRRPPGADDLFERAVQRSLRQRA